MKNFLSFIALFSLSFNVYCHEQWFLSKNEMYALNNLPLPAVFSQIGFFNISIISLFILISIIWIYFDRPNKLIKINSKIRVSSFILRITTGTTLLLSGIGLTPKFNTSHLIPTLFAPDLIIPPGWIAIRWIEILLSLFLIFGFLTRFTALCFIVFLLFSLFLYGSDLLQYFGFYLAMFIFLVREGNGITSTTHLNLTKHKISIIILQTLTGINFIYSGISIKLLQPNLDIVILEHANAFTFGMPYDYFTFLMCIVEITVGVLIVVGAKLNYLALFLMILFTFLSVNLSENVVLHLFIYGILLVFIVLKGINIFKPKKI